MNNPRRKSFGIVLTQDFRLHVRCEKCDLPIEKIKWNDKKIAISTNKNPRDGFICLRCFTSRKAGKTVYRTEEQLEEFFKKKSEKLITN